MTRNPRSGGIPTPTTEWGADRPAQSAGAAATRSATQATERVAESAQSAFEQARTRVTEQAHSVATAMQKATEHLKQEDQQGLARQVEKVGRQAERVSDYLRERSPADMLNDLERVARERPALVLGSAFLLGMLSARFLKSSKRGGNGGSGTHRSTDRLRDTAANGYGMQNPGAPASRQVPGVMHGTP